jgi:hypothetical protein
MPGDDTGDCGGRGNPAFWNPADGNPLFIMRRCGLSKIITEENTSNFGFTEVLMKPVALVVVAKTA